VIPRGTAHIGLAKSHPLLDGFIFFGRITVFILSFLPWVSFSSLALSGLGRLYFAVVMN
jgi:hypothetical protein